MYESRCGVRCNTCERKEKVNCKGCVNMEKPFWGGECEVKSCCEEKKLRHCGECIMFPCEMLSNLGKEFGYTDSLPRISALREWRQETRGQK